MTRVPVLLTPTEVAVLLRTSRKAIYTMIERAQLARHRADRAPCPRPPRRSARLPRPQQRAIATGDKAMSVTIRKYRRGGWEVDIRLRLPNGRRYRERGKAPGTSKSAAQRWAEDRERHLLLHGPEPKRSPLKEVPTLREFAPRFLQDHAVANRQKPSGIAAKESILRVHLVPALGDKRLDAIKNEDIQRLKSAAPGQGPEDREQRADGPEHAC